MGPPGLVLLLVLLAPAALRAEPITIADTGPAHHGLPGFSLYQGQWLAAEFDVTTPAVITGVQGWMEVWHGGMLTLSLYRDGGATPGALLFRSTDFINSGTTTDWRGLAGLAWAVTPGAYWIAFEPRGSSALSGVMPYPSARPLANGAAAHGDSAFRYFQADSVQIGVRIFGEAPAPIPEPASMLLLGTGLAGLAARRWRRR